MQPEDINDMQFRVRMRGYLRSEVDAYRVELARQVAQRDAAIVAREWALAKQRQAPPAVSPTVPDRAELLRSLGHEAASSLAGADVAALERKAQLEAGAAQVGRTLQELAARLRAAQEAVAGLRDEALAASGDTGPGSAAAT